jgi:purine-nucleoside phosphorylase
MDWHTKINETEGFPSVFKRLFGIVPAAVRRVCVLLPFVTKEVSKAFGSPSFSAGSVYEAADCSAFTLIRTGIGPALAGDCVLLLKDTACRDVVLFGSCGAVNESFFREDIVAVVSRTLCAESFTAMLRMKKPGPWMRADCSLLKKILSHCGSFPLKESACMTAGSLWLEVPFLKKIGAFQPDVVDMESSAVYSAAKAAGKRAVALLFATDHVLKFPYDRALASENRASLSRRISACSETVVSLLKTVFPGADGLD